MSALRLIRSPSKNYQVGLQVPANVSDRARRLHARGLSNAKMMFQAEKNLLDDLLEIDETQAFAEFGCSSLYAYAPKWLELTESVALNLIAVMRRGKQVPELVQAIKSGMINVSAARKISPVINQTNKDAWLELASTNTLATIEKAVATACPKLAVRESIRYVSADRLEFTLGISEEFRDTLKELKDLKSQKQKVAVDSEDAILSAMKNEIARISPLEKGEAGTTARGKETKGCRNQRERRVARRNCESDSNTNKSTDRATNRNTHAAIPTPSKARKIHRRDDARGSLTRWFPMHRNNRYGRALPANAVARYSSHC